VTNEEMDAVRALTIIEGMESDMMVLARFDMCGGGTDAEQNTVRTMLRTWKAGIRNKLTIRAARSDKGKERT
jgi:hypothetical protein